jgi:hypothetical protein
MAKIKGICRNEECDHCDEIMEAEKSNFVCEHCGKPLFPINNQTGGGGDGGGMNVKLIAIIAAAVVVLGAGAFFLFSGSDEPEPQPQEVVAPEPAAPDTVAAEPAEPAAEPAAPAKPAEPKAKEPAKPQNGYVSNYNLGYGKYTGDLKNGKPHGHGTIVYTAQHTITGSYVASPGDKYEGDFRDGRVSGGLGYWTTKDGNMKTINPKVVTIRKRL